MPPSVPPVVDTAGTSSFLGDAHRLDSADVITAGNYRFNTHNLGCTQLIRGEAFDVTTGRTRPVVGKMVSHEDLSSFMHREGRVLSVLHSQPHPGLHRIRTVQESKDPAVPSFIVFDKLGPDLYSYVRSKGLLPETETVHIFRQLVAAVAHCHENLVVLRDIKMGKVFFSGAGRNARLVIGDLWGAELVDEADPLLTDQKGSPAYVSPEVLRSVPHDGRSADVWALGVVLFVMLTGTYPFEDSRPDHLIRKIQAGTASVVFPPHVTVPLRDLIRRLLDRDPCNRPSAAALLDDPLLGGRDRRRVRLFTDSPIAAVSATTLEEPGDADQVVPDLSPSPTAKARATRECRDVASSFKRQRRDQV